MKSMLFFLVLLLSVSIYAQSPVSKGAVNLNGNLFFSSQSYETSAQSLSILSINPQVSYFVVDNFSLGFAISYERRSIGASSTNYGIGPSIRYYFTLDRLYPFISLGYSFTQSFNSQNDDSYKGKQYIITGGVAYFLAKNVALEAAISYKWDRNTLPDSFKSYYKDLEIKSNIIMLGIGINIFIY